MKDGWITPMFTGMTEAISKDTNMKKISKIIFIAAVISVLILIHVTKNRCDFAGTIYNSDELNTSSSIQFRDNGICDMILDGLCIYNPRGMGGRYNYYVKFRKLIIFDGNSEYYQFNIKKDRICFDVDDSYGNDQNMDFLQKIRYFEKWYWDMD